MSNPLLIPALAVAAVVSLAGPSAASPPDAESFQVGLASCAPGDDLVGDFTVWQTFGRTPSSNMLHLHLAGTITRTGTGEVGKYAEIQLDRFGADGTETYAGTLSRLVVPGSGTVSASGRAVVDGDDFAFTPHLSPIMDDDFVAQVCEALG